MTVALLAVFTAAQLATAAEHCAPAAVAPTEASHSHAPGHAHEHAEAPTTAITHHLVVAAADDAMTAAALTVCGAMILLLIGLGIARLLRRSGWKLLTVLPRSLIPQPPALLLQRLSWSLSLNQLAISRT